MHIWSDEMSFSIPLHGVRQTFSIEKVADTCSIKLLLFVPKVRIKNVFVTR